MSTLRSDVADILDELCVVSHKASQIVPKGSTTQTSYHQFEASAVKALLDRASQLIKEVRQATPVPDVTS